MQITVFVLQLYYTQRIANIRLHIQRQWLVYVRWNRYIIRVKKLMDATIKLTATPKKIKWICWIAFQNASCIWRPTKLYDSWANQTSKGQTLLRCLQDQIVRFVSHIYIFYGSKREWVWVWSTAGASADNSLGEYVPALV